MIRTVPVQDVLSGAIITIGGQDKMWIFAPNLEDYLQRILNQLRIMNMHNETLTGNHITEEDLDED